MIRGWGAAGIFALALCACGDGDGTLVDTGVVDAGGPPGDGAASGRPCFSGVQETDSTLVASPALECPTRTCLHIQDAPVDRCTARCEQPGDCIASPDSTCAGGFDCVAPVSIGPFACQRMCVCVDDISGSGFPSCP